MNLLNKLEKKKRLVRLICFVSTVILASTAVMFTTFLDSTLFLMIILLPCIITLSLSIIPTSLSARNLLLFGIISCLASLLAIIYVVVTRPEMVKQYLIF